MQGTCLSPAETQNWMWPCPGFALFLLSARSPWVGACGGISLPGNDESPVGLTTGGRLLISGITNDLLLKECRWNRDGPIMKLA